MGAQDLAAKIADAEHERAVWEAGQRAYRDEGSAALNPCSPHSPDYGLWAEGFENERSKKRYPEWLDDGEPVTSIGMP